jgi:hypothetical protein
MFLLYNHLQAEIYTRTSEINTTDNSLVGI